MIKFWKTDDEYGFFSNFSKHSIEIDGKKYRTTEHFYQAMKMINEENHEKVRKAKNPKVSKSLAYSMPLRKDWEEIKVSVMKKALLAKIHKYEFIKNSLLETKDQEIAENSPYDFEWGLGCDGTGKNLLGKLLVEIREEIKNEISTKSD